jgi:hypothetical protein
VGPRPFLDILENIKLLARAGTWALNCPTRDIFPVTTILSVHQFKALEFEIHQLLTYKRQVCRNWERSFSVCVCVCVCVCFVRACVFVCITLTICGIASRHPHNTYVRHKRFLHSWQWRTLSYRMWRRIIWYMFSTFRRKLLHFFTITVKIKETGFSETSVIMFPWKSFVFSVRLSQIKCFVNVPNDFRFSPHGWTMVLSNEHVTDLPMFISYNLGRCISYIPIFSQLLVAVFRQRRKPQDTWIRTTVSRGACQTQIRSPLAKLLILLSISQYIFPSKNPLIKARVLIMKKGSANRFVRGGRRLDRSGEPRKAREKSPQEIGFLLLAFCTKKQLSHGTITALRKHSVS